MIVRETSVLKSLFEKKYILQTCSCHYFQSDALFYTIFLSIVSSLRKEEVVRSPQPNLTQDLMLVPTASPAVNHAAFLGVE